MEKRALLAESMLEAIEKQASEELRVMEKRAVMAESMLEATLDFHAGAVPRTKRGTDPKSKGDESKDSSRFHNHTHSKYFLSPVAFFCIFYPFFRHQFSFENLTDPINTTRKFVVLFALAIWDNICSVDWDRGVTQDGDSALEKRQNASKFEEAEKFTANKISIFGRPFPLRDKNKVLNS